MHYTLIGGSHRSQSQSMKVAQYIQRQLRRMENCDRAEIFSLAANPLPLWDEGVWENDEGWKSRLQPMRDLFDDSDAFVVITPEWHGQVPAGLKNLFLLTGKQEVGHKPALIVSVSAGTGGAYPVAELRMSSYKNNRICYIPEQVIIRHVEQVLNDDPTANDSKADQYLRERIDWSLQLLSGYASALREVRSRGLGTHPKFANGM